MVQEGPIVDESVNDRPFFFRGSTNWPKRVADPSFQSEMVALWESGKLIPMIERCQSSQAKLIKHEGVRFDYLNSHRWKQGAVFDPRLNMILESSNISPK